MREAKPFWENLGVWVFQSLTWNMNTDCPHVQSWSLGLTLGLFHWLQHRAEAATVPGQGSASEIQDSDHGWGHCCSGSRDRSSYPDDHPKGVLPLHNYHHCPQATHHHGQQQVSVEAGKGAELDRRSLNTSAEWYLTAEGLPVILLMKKQSLRDFK